ncbi:unnamed protein product [Owenia fusiformis]|uniref:Uncharacterized protein n=1 Tax=Owenia fusiformis TaxID=6347 RepID=A0A8J1TI43_OWEFU|nr:unnamed protein product [Owenia fusiformis]
MEILIKVTVLMFLIHIAEAGQKKNKQVLGPELCKEELSAAINKFGIDMYMELSASHPGENVFFSPISITTALSMLMLGAKGETKSQMEEVLYTTELQRCLHETYNFWEKNLYGGEDGPVLESANKLYTDQTLDANRRFVKDIAKYYDASVQKLDFKDHSDASRNTINDWVSDQTSQMIQNVLEKGSIDQNTVMVLINAIYFKGNWLNQFDISDTSVESFTTETGKVVNVNMMYQEDLFNHYYDNDLKAQFLELPYEVGTKNSVDIRMVIILPEGKDGILELQEKLTAEMLSKALDELQYWPTPTYLHVPRFEFKEKYQLHSILEDMGMDELFSASVNLDGFSTDPRVDVSTVVHEAAVVINENGTEASAVTVIGGGRSGYIPDPATVKCDRPFLFLIREVKEEKDGWAMKTIPGPILFFGKVSEPIEAKDAICNAEDLNNCRDMCRLNCFEANKRLTNKSRKKNCPTWVGLFEKYRNCKTDCRKDKCVQNC